MPLNLELETLQKGCLSSTNGHCFNNNGKTFQLLWSKLWDIGYEIGAIGAKYLSEPRICEPLKPSRFQLEEL